LDLRAMQGQYDRILKSPEWREADLAAKSFVASYDYSTLSFANESEILNWLQNNYRLTTFSSYAEAEASFNNVKIKLENLYLAHERFFQEFVRLDQIDREATVGIWEDVVEYPEFNLIAYNSCEMNCINEGAACVKAARQNYNFMVAAIGSASWYNLPLQLGAWATAYTTYQTTARICGIRMNNCYDACP